MTHHHWRFDISSQNRTFLLHILLFPARCGGKYGLNWTLFQKLCKKQSIYTLKCTYFIEWYDRKWQISNKQSFQSVTNVTGWGWRDGPSSCRQVSGTAAAHSSSAKAKQRLGLWPEFCLPGRLWRRTPCSRLSSRSEQLWAVCTYRPRRERCWETSPWSHLLQGRETGPQFNR